MSLSDESTQPAPPVLEDTIAVAAAAAATIETALSSVIAASKTDPSGRSVLLGLCCRAYAADPKAVQYLTEPTASVKLVQLAARFGAAAQKDNPSEAIEAFVLLARLVNDYALGRKCGPLSADRAAARWEIMRRCLPLAEERRAIAELDAAEQAADQARVNAAAPEPAWMRITVKTSTFIMPRGGLLDTAHKIVAMFNPGEAAALEAEIKRIEGENAAFGALLRQAVVQHRELRA